MSCPMLWIYCHCSFFTGGPTLSAVIWASSKRCWTTNTGAETHTFISSNVGSESKESIWFSNERYLTVSVGSEMELLYVLCSKTIQTCRQLSHIWSPTHQGRSFNLTYQVETPWGRCRIKFQITTTCKYRTELVARALLHIKRGHELKITWVTCIYQVYNWDVCEGFASHSPPLVIFSAGPQLCSIRIMSSPHLCCIIIFILDAIGRTQWAGCMKTYFLKLDKFYSQSNIASVPLGCDFCTCLAQVPSTICKVINNSGHDSWTYMYL